MERLLFTNDELEALDLCLNAARNAEAWADNIQDDDLKRAILSAARLIAYERAERDGR